MIPLPYDPVPYVPGPGVNLADLGTLKRGLVPNDEVRWVDLTVGKDAMAAGPHGRTRTSAQKKSVSVDMGEDNN